jgi:hypothetical protein
MAPLLSDYDPAINGRDGATRVACLVASNLPAGHRETNKSKLNILSHLWGLFHRAETGGARSKKQSPTPNHGRHELARKLRKLFQWITLLWLNVSPIIHSNFYSQVVNETFS